MFPGLTLPYWLTVHGLVTLIAVMLYAVTAHVLQQRRHPTAAIAWVLFILLVPYVALPSFLIFGSRKQVRPRIMPLQDKPETDAEGPWAIQTALALGQPQPEPYLDLRVHPDGHAALAALWEIIDGAQRTIDVCTFIIGRDRVGNALVEHLVAKARAGVKVRLMLDGLGSLMSRRPDLTPLTAAGVEFVRFVPPLHSPLKGRTNLRDHRKILLADAALPGRRLWCGGRNLAAEYFEGDVGKPAWRDLTFDLGGAFVKQASSLFEHDWAFAIGKDRHVEIEEARAPSVHETRAQLIASGPDQADDTVYSLLVTAAYRARRRISLITPYFVPDSGLLMALCMAARRGVQVDLLLPAASNHRMSDVARRRALRALAASGGRLWTVPYMIHAKLAVIDETLALAGSANLDSRSLFLNYELMVAFHDRDAIARFASWFEHERVGATLLEPKPAGLFQDMAEGLVLWTGFQL